MNERTYIVGSDLAKAVMAYQILWEMPCGDGVMAVGDLICADDEAEGPLVDLSRAVAELVDRYDEALQAPPDVLASLAGMRAVSRLLRDMHPEILGPEATEHRAKVLRQVEAFIEDYERQVKNGA